MSLSIDDAYLYGDDIGIYKNFQEDWMRAGNIEFIKDGKSQFSENIGLKLHGDSSRGLPLKSFTIYLKSKYNKSYIDFPLFIDKPNIRKVTSFILRNSGQDWSSTYMRDALTHSIAKDMGNIDYLSYEPTIVFINGQYFGMLNLREKANKDYIKNNHYLNSSNFNLLSYNYGDVKIINGNSTDFKQLHEYIENYSFTSEKNYLYIQKQIDMDEFINYIALQTYINNMDWIYKNIKYWKKHNSQSQWHTILYDTDFGFGYQHTFYDSSVEFNSFNFLSTHQFTNKNMDLTYKLYTKLLKNHDFQKKFSTQYNTLLQTLFLPENINKKITTIKNKIAPEMPRHLKKWFGEERTFEDWENNVEVLYNYSNARNDIVREQLENLF
jgi:hypothetical protein